MELAQSCNCLSESHRDREVQISVEYYCPKRALAPARRASGSKECESKCGLFGWYKCYSQWKCDQRHDEELAQEPSQWANRPTYDFFYPVKLKLSAHLKFRDGPTTIVVTIKVTHTTKTPANAVKNLVNKWSRADLRILSEYVLSNLKFGRNDAKHQPYNSSPNLTFSWLSPRRLAEITSSTVWLKPFSVASNLIGVDPFFGNMMEQPLSSSHSNISLPVVFWLLSKVTVTTL